MMENTSRKTLDVIISVFELDSEKVIRAKVEINPKLIIASPILIFLLTRRFKGSTIEMIIIAMIGRIISHP